MNRKNKELVLIAFLTLGFGVYALNVGRQMQRTPSSVSPTSTFKKCIDDPERQKLRSEELQQIVQADQADRSGDVTAIDWDKVQPADETRRKRVGEIFGEGCFKTAKDYSAAALVFQHGNRPDHFYQTYLWAKKSIELGDSSQKQLMADGIDRYLINIGHQQLFATQYSISKADHCECLEKVEETFPDQKRMEVRGKTLAEVLASVQEKNKDKPACKNIQYCDKPLQASPAGIFPGVW